MTKKDCIIIAICYIVVCVIVYFCEKNQNEHDYSDEIIADAIYIAEGGEKAAVPYGIMSVKVKNEAEARQVCLNTIRNNRKRYDKYGYKQHDSFLEFLGSRYAPIGAENDKYNLNKNWVKNVRFYVKKLNAKD